MVKGPSQSYWERDSDRYFERTNTNVKCQATRNAHKATLVAIGNGQRGGETTSAEDRFYSHWMLIFPGSIILDNSVFSPGNTSILAKSVVGMEEKLSHGKKDHIHFGTVVFWRIGVKGKSKQLKAEQPFQMPDPNDVFG